MPERDGSTLDTELARLTRADERYAQGQWDAASQGYADLAKRFPRNAFVWFRLGNCHVRLHQLDQAAQAYRIAQSLDPSDGRFPYNLGLVRKAQARAAFEDAQARLPNNEALRAEALLQALQLASESSGHTRDGK